VVAVLFLEPAATNVEDLHLSMHADPQLCSIIDGMKAPPQTKERW
jgi:hypothetical protein